MGLPVFAARAICAAALYGSAVAWFSGVGSTPSRRAAVVVGAIAAVTEAVLEIGARGVLLPVMAVAAAAIGASAGATEPFWEPVVYLAILFWHLVRWSPLCCGRAPQCCCVCNRLCCFRGADRTCAYRPYAIQGVVARILFACAAVLLLPALAAQSYTLDCMSASEAFTGSRVYRFNRYLVGADDVRNTAEAPDGVQLFRSMRDQNASYAAWVHSSRELFFAGTKTAKMLVLDLTVTPRTLRYNGSVCPAVTVHKGFYDVYEAVRDDVHAAMRSALADNASAPVTISGFSLGSAVASIATLDLFCSGVMQPSQIVTFSMAGPGVCSGDACAGAFDSMQAAGLHLTRVVNPFDLISWLPAFMYEPLRTPHALLSFTSLGQFMLAAHQGAGYVPSPLGGGCAGLRALAWLPFVVAALLALACSALQPRVPTELPGMSINDIRNAEIPVGEPTSIKE
jgi:hypothetical protein